MKEKGSLPLTSSSHPDARWELVLRVADSNYFRKGPKLRAFLLYVCENTILGRPENVREQLIGAKVFGRPNDYSLSDDNIVRVEARELRKRLETYFANEGQAERVVIEIPKGAYVPIFRPREESAYSLVETAEPPATTTAKDVLSRSWLTVALAIGLIVSLVVTLWLLLDNRRLRQSQTPAEMDTRFSPEDYSVYAVLLGAMGRLPNREPKLVLCNPKVVLYFGSQNPAPMVGSLDTTLPAPKDLEHSFRPALNGKDKEMPYHFFRITQHDYTGTGEATAAFYIGRLMDSLARPVHLTQARFLNWDNVQREDLILLGGPSSNDWTSQADPKSDFVFSGRSILNLRPLPGEPNEYVADASPNARGALEEYGFLKMHTSSEGFRTLLLAGLSGAGTAGVAEFFATPAKVRAVAERIAAAAPGKPFPADWEVIMRIAVQDGLPVDTSAVTVHPAPAIKP